MEKIKIRDYEITLEEYQVNILLDILREFMKANILKNSEELIKKLELLSKNEVVKNPLWNQLFKNLSKND